MIPINSVCLITGFTSGIGKAAAEKFASRGCKLILVARNRHRGEKVIDEIVRATSNNNLTLFTADLSSAEDIKNLSDKIHDAYDYIDVIINNAGAHFSKFHLSIDGIEATFAVNYLSRFLLTNQLLDLTLKSPSARIINVNGEYHRFGKLNLSVGGGSDFTPFQAACRSKLADILFVMELARRLRNTGVTVNAYHPGAVSTDAINNDPDASWQVKFLYSVCRPFFRNADKAGADLFYLAFDEGLKSTTGEYFVHKKIKQPSEAALDPQLARQLWDFSESLTGYSNSLFTHNKILEK